MKDIHELANIINIAITNETMGKITIKDNIISKQGIEPSADHLFSFNFSQILNNISSILFIISLYEWAILDSNQGPTVYETVASNH